MRTSRHPLYKTWSEMHRRCYSINHPAYARYGGRGIRVCARWESFELFVQDMGERPHGHSLDRINNNGNYTPSNCRWATATQQANNRRRRTDGTLYEYKGQLKTVCEWGKELGIPHRRLFMRLLRGWSIERALTEEKHWNYDRFPKP